MLHSYLLSLRGRIATRTRHIPVLLSSLLPRAPSGPAAMVGAESSTNTYVSAEGRRCFHGQAVGFAPHTVPVVPSNPELVPEPLLGLVTHFWEQTQDPVNGCSYVKVMGVAYLGPGLSSPLALEPH